MTLVIFVLRLWPQRPTSLNKNETKGVCITQVRRLLSNSNKDSRGPLFNPTSISEISHLVTIMTLLSLNNYQLLVLCSTYNEQLFFFHSNIAEALVSKGLATVIKYRQTDDQRSSCYDDLLRAEDRAEKKGVGVHSKKEAPIIRVADLSGVIKWFKFLFLGSFVRFAFVIFL